MVRGEQMVQLKFSNLARTPDGISINLSIGKKKQDNSIPERRNLMANPRNPLRCHFVHLGVHLATWLPGVNCDDKYVYYGGKNLSKELIKAFQKVLKTPDLQHLCEEHGYVMVYALFLASLLASG